jgi:STE24 endopeptidase
MFHLLVIGVFFTVLLRDELGPPLLDVAPPSGRLISAGVMLGGLALIWLLTAVFVRVCARMLDRAGRARAASTAELLVLFARIASVLYFVLCVLSFGWVEVVRLTLSDLTLGFLNSVGVDELLAALPGLASIALGWWILHPIDARLREALLLRQLDEGKPVYAQPTRWQSTWLACRHHLGIIVIPVALIIMWGDAVESAAAWWFGVDQIQEARAAAQGAVTAVHLLGTLTVFTLMPPLMCLVWDTAPMTTGKTHDELAGMCRDHGVRIRGIRIWNTRGSMVNGAVMGLIARFRYILLTDALLGSLPRREVEAVMAHEIGHVRRRHLVWLAASLVATLLFTLLLGEAAVSLLWATAVPGPVNALLTVLILALTIATFGYVSRRFEWQADAFAVTHLSRHPFPAPIDTDFGAEPAEPLAPPGPPKPASRATPEAVSSMVTALQHVAVLNGIPIRRFTFRHGSIADRQRRIRRLEGLELARLPIDRNVRVIKALSLLAIGAAVAGYALLLAL